MQTVFVLGAGFSRAVSAAMPLTDELGEVVRDRLPEARARSPRGFTGGYFEAWLSRLAEPQPDLTSAANAANHALFLQVAEEIHRIMQERELQVLLGTPPWWLQRLVGVMHATRSPVVTFNYDTLIERTVAYLGLSDWGRESTTVKASNLVRDIPPAPRRGGFLHDPGSQSLRLLKLHGSLDNYWVPGDVSGATIQRLPLAGTWGEPVPVDEQERREQLPGREPFIVPPAAAKSAFYNNPISRELWQSTARALAGAARVSLIGYSLPPTDLVSSGMLTDALTRDDVIVDVVNPYPKGVADRLAALGVPQSCIRCTDGTSAVETYIAELERHVGSRVTEGLEAVDEDRHLIVGTSPSRSARVLGLKEVDDEVHLVTTEAGDTAEITRVVPGATQQTVTVAALRAVAKPGTVLRAIYGDGTTAVIVGLAEFATETGLGNGRWTVLVASAVENK
ncbi:hypothetical protein [Micromonospora echinaurantiaca]|uniref:hypothetical protein n=1 Tax=Micromonospora echinaurantiaca TaxID=47857 RepID=UPI003434CA5B